MAQHSRSSWILWLRWLIPGQQGEQAPTPVHIQRTLMGEKLEFEQPFRLVTFTQSHWAPPIPCIRESSTGA